VSPAHATSLALPHSLCEAANDAEIPQQFRNKRAFAVWAVDLGLAPPERLTELVIPEVMRELAGLEEEAHARPS